MSLSLPYREETTVGPTVALLGIITMDTRKDIVPSDTSLYLSVDIKDDGSDLISEGEHALEDSCGRASSESYQLFIREELQPSPTEDALDGTVMATAAESLTEAGRSWVCEVGVASDQGIRSSMEDEHVAVVDADVAFFGVYDGHGGRQCAEYVRDHLHKAVFDHTARGEAPRRAISDAFALVEREFLETSDTEATAAGCVCAAALLQGDLLCVGNVGDCEAVLSRNGKPMLLTVRHNPSTNAAEAARVVEAGGCIVNHRVGHPRLNPRLCSLAVSRAVGDAGFKLDTYTLGKSSGIIAEADICEVRLTEEDEFLLVACDGLWDTMTYEEAVNLCTRYLQEGLDANGVADKLVGEALIRGTRDNITVLFVRLGPDAMSSTMLK